MEEQVIMHSYSGHNKTPTADKQSQVFSNEEKILSNQDIKIDSNEITRDLWKSNGDSKIETCVNDLLVRRESEISSDIHHLLRSARIIFMGDLYSPSWESRQYEGNEPPWPRKSVLSEYSCYSNSIVLTVQGVSFHPVQQYFT